MKKREHITGFSLNKGAIAIWILAVIILAAIFYFFGKTLEQYGLTFYISFGSLVVASIAAIGTLLSLQWTRNTIRPFLLWSGASMTPVIKDNYVTLPFRIHNCGSLPASDVEVNIDFFNKEEEVSEDNLSDICSIPIVTSELPLIFPNDQYEERFVLNLDDNNESELWEKIKRGDVKLRLRIKYSSQGRKHATIITQKLCKPEWSESVIFTQIPPLKWK